VTDNHQATVYSLQDWRQNARAPAGIRVSPHNIEAEQALLGAILINNDAFHQVSEFLTSEMFYEPVHGRIYAAMRELISSGTIADHVTLHPAFDADEALAKLDGAQYLGRLSRAAESVMVVRDYGLHVMDLACKRWLIEISEEMLNSCFASEISTTWPDIARRCKDELEKIERYAGRSLGWLGMPDLIERLALMTEQPPRHFPTGLWALDQDLGGGFLPGRVYGFEAPRKSFKTGLLATILKEQIARGVKVLYVMADRTMDESIGRIVAAALHKNVRDLERGNDHETARAIRALNWKTPIMLAEEPSISLRKLKALVARAVDQGAKGIVLDYWQRVDAIEGPRDSKPAALGRVADWIKAEAMEDDVWWAVASQQNAEGETLWSGELSRACVWLGRLKMIEYPRLTGPETCLYLDVPVRTHGSAGSIGSEAQPAWTISDEGPLLMPWMP
jgi:replicative DNA helicase